MFDKWELFDIEKKEEEQLYCFVVTKMENNNVDFSVFTQEEWTRLETINMEFNKHKRWNTNKTDTNKHDYKHNNELNKHNNIHIISWMDNELKRLFEMKFDQLDATQNLTQKNVIVEFDKLKSVHLMYKNKLRRWFLTNIMTLEYYYSCVKNNYHP